MKPARREWALIVREGSLFRPLGRDREPETNTLPKQHLLIAAFFLYNIFSYSQYAFMVGAAVNP
jgi:hypothetical protein